MSAHVATWELAEYSEGLLTPAQREAVATHLDGCPSCRAELEQLAEVSTLLASAPAQPMPTAVATRLERVVVAEQEHRAASATSGSEGRPSRTAAVNGVGGAAPHNGSDPPAMHRLTQDSFEDRFRHQIGRRRGRTLLTAVGALAAAGVVGLGGYVVSAQAGTNEPQATGAVVRSSSLKTDAQKIEETQDLDAYRFTEAWSCARKVTDGKITGIVAVTVDDASALLVYTARTHDTATVTVVRGCETDHPAAGPSTVVPR